MSRLITPMDVDWFRAESLADPFAIYQGVREAGPVVHLVRHDLYAIGRFADVQTALRSADVLISGRGVGFGDTFNGAPGAQVISTDGDLHFRMRAAVMRPLSPKALKGARADLKAMVSGRVSALIGTGWTDAMKTLAAFLPLEAVSHLVGLPAVGRDRMLDWAAATFNLIGPVQDPADLAALSSLKTFMASLSADTVREGSWAGELLKAAQEGRLSEAEAMSAISAYIIPSLDTTILAKGHLLNNLAANPDQWALLKSKPELIPNAVLESVRRDSVIRGFSRVAVADYDVDGAVVPAGARVMLLYGCANRDERRYAAPDCFDITRDARDHLAWGTGPHMCAGMHLARIEMEVLLEALVEADVQLAARAPTVGTNRGLYGFTALPMSFDVGVKPRREVP